MAGNKRQVDANMVQEAIKQLKPKLVQIKQDVPASIPPSFYSRAVMAVHRKDVVDYIIKRYGLDAAVVIVEIHLLDLDNEITLLTGKDGEKYIDANIGKQG